jgi:hypothetical protein
MLNLRGFQRVAKYYCAVNNIHDFRHYRRFPMKSNTDEVDRDQLRLRATFGAMENERKTQIIMRRHAHQIIFSVVLIAGTAMVLHVCGHQIMAAAQLATARLDRVVAFARTNMFKPQQATAPLEKTAKAAKRKNSSKTL